MSDPVARSAAVRTVTELYESDQIAADLGIALGAVGPDRVELTMTVSERHVGWHGRCHGSVLFALADIAMSYLGNRAGGQAFATHAAVDFVGPVERGDDVLAVAIEVSQRGRAAINDVTLSVAGEVVAVFRGNTLRVS